MSFEVIGACHKSATLEERERIAVPAGVPAKKLAGLKKACGLEELVILSTCNRVEFYFRGEGEGLWRRLVREAGVGEEEAGRMLYRCRGLEAGTHLFAVAAGLDSMVVGETEVLSQCKTAYEAALAAGTTGPVLNAAFQQAFLAAKKAHTQTGISKGRTSVGSVAAALVKKRLRSMSKKTLLVVGAGTMAKNTLSHVAGLGPGRVVVANRSRSRARELAGRFGGEAAGLEDMGELLAQADVVVTSAASRSYILTRRDVSRSQRERGGAKVVILDIAVPRNVEPSAGAVEGVELFNIDSLKELSEANATTRRDELPKALSIVGREAARLERKLLEREAAPLIHSLTERSRRVAEREVRKALRNMEKGAGAEEEMGRLAERIVNKFLHEPVSAVKKSVSRGEADGLLAAARELFGLEENGKKS